MSETVLVLNAGSSSLKFAAYNIEDLSVRLRGSVSRIGDGASFEVTGGDSAIEPPGASFRADGDHADHMRWLLNSIGDWLPETRVAALGHRVVHGGQAFSEPVRVD
ncbi:MAG: acetate kinase, partial [Pseudomonadota bacterium]